MRADNQRGADGQSCCLARRSTRQARRSALGRRPTDMDTAFSKQVLLAPAASGQRSELEGAPTISEAKDQIIRLRRQTRAL